MVHYDALVVGAGPNGLAAGAELTRAGRRVLVVEAAEEIGGGTRTAELTLPGFLHDICSAIHPLGVASPFFRSLNLEVEWVQPPIPVSHPLGGGRAAALTRSLEETARLFGDDGGRYRRILEPLVASAEEVVDAFLGPLTFLPEHPVSFTRFTLRGTPPASLLASRFSTEAARAVMAGLAAHAIAPFNRALTSGVTLLFALTTHAFGWPLVRGGSQRLADALGSVVVEGGGSIETRRRVSDLGELPRTPLTLLDVMPDAALRMAGDRITTRTRRRLARWRSGPAVFKVDWALDGPIPWRDEWSGRAGTVHVGGTWEEVSEAERMVHGGGHPERPFVFVAQQSLFDATRAPDGRHTAWGYCHVPAGSTVDMTERMESQIERFAPGFRERILARHTMNSLDYEKHNPNIVGGDIAGGRFGMRRVLQFGANAPYRLGEGVYLCSSATPPGAGVHGMCGYHAARAALRALP